MRTEAFILRREVFRQMNFYTQKLLQREVCTQRNFCTEEILSTEAFTERNLYYTDNFFYTETFKWFKNVQNPNFISVFHLRPSCERGTPRPRKLPFHQVFGHNFCGNHSCVAVQQLLWKLLCKNSSVNDIVGFCWR